MSRNGRGRHKDFEYSHKAFVTAGLTVVLAVAIDRETNRVLIVIRRRLVPSRKDGVFKTKEVGGFQMK